LHHVDLRLLQSCQRRSATMARKPGCGYQSPQHSIVRARSERGSMGICGARPATKRPRTDDSRIRLKTALAKGRMPHANRQEDFAPHLAYEVGAFNGCYRGAGRYWHLQVPPKKRLASRLFTTGIIPNRCRCAGCANSSWAAE
jgi:hypothetical protein